MVLVGPLGRGVLGEPDADLRPPARHRRLAAVGLGLRGLGEGRGAEAGDLGRSLQGPIRLQPGDQGARRRQVQGGLGRPAGHVQGLSRQGGPDRLRLRPPHRPRMRRFPLPGHPLLRRRHRGSPAEGRQHSPRRRSVAGMDRPPARREGRGRIRLQGGSEGDVLVPLGIRREGLAGVQQVRLRHRHHAAAESVGDRRLRDGRQGPAHLGVRRRPGERDQAVRDRPRRPGDRPRARDPEEQLRQADLPVDELPRYADRPGRPDGIPRAEAASPREESELRRHRDQRRGDPFEADPAEDRQVNDEPL